MSDNQPPLLPQGSMSQTKISGLKTPSKLARPTGPLRSLTTASTTTSIKSATSSSTINNESTIPEVSNAEFKIGETCWVNGSKLGTVAFIGETQFKEGMWAGVILNTADGKNDGSLDGVKYFVTEPNRGIFCRLNKLTKEPQEVAVVSEAGVLNTSIHESGLLIGSRVSVVSSQGTKVGVLRFLGATEFAKGEWAGVELDEKLGKNDGSVADKRYFTCKPMYGVFAPVAKVSLFTQTESPSIINSRVSSLQTSGKGNSSLNLAKKVINKQMSGSQESLNSISQLSTASGIRPHKTGIMSKIGSQTPNLSSLAAKKQASNTPVLQTLKEKESHIAQLLKERDFERAEFTRAAQKFEQTEVKLADYTKALEERDFQVLKLTEQVEKLTEQTQSLAAQLDTDTSRIEDLEFQIEEHKLGCVDMELVEENKDTLVCLTSVQALDVEEQAKIQLEASKALKEQIEVLKIELKQLKLGEEVYAQEKSDLKRNIEDLEKKLKIAAFESLEHANLQVKCTELNEHIKQVELDRDRLQKQSEEMTALAIKLEASENLKAEFEFQFHEENAKLVELNGRLAQVQEQLEEKSKDVIKLKMSQNQNETDVEFALEEQKVLVQELEKDLAARYKEMEEIKAAGIKQIKNLENQLEDALVGRENALAEVKEKNSKIESLNTEAAEFRKTKETEVQELTDKLARVNAEAGDVSIDLKNELEKLLSQLADSHKRIEELTSIIEGTTINTSAQTEVIKSQQVRLEEREKEVFNLEQVISSLKASLIDKEAEIDKFKIDLKALKDHEHQIASVNQSLEEKVVALESQIGDNRKTNEELKTRIAEMIENSGDSSSQLTALNLKVIEKEKAVEEAQGLIVNEQKEVTRLVNENQELVKKLKELQEVQNEVEQLNVRLDEEKKASLGLHSELDESVKANKDLTNELIKVQKSAELTFDKLIKLETDLKDKTSELEASKLNHQTDKSSAEDQLLVLKKLIEDTELKSSRQIEGLEREKQSLEAEVSRTSEELNSSRLQTDALIKKVDNLDETLKAIREESEADKKLLESLSAEKESLVAEKESLILKSETLACELKAMHLSEQDSLTGQIIKLKNDYEEVIVKKDLLQTELKTLSNELDLSKEVHNTLTNNIELLSVELTALKKENTELHATLKKNQQDTGSTDEETRLLKIQLEEVNKKVNYLECSQKDSEAKIKNLVEMIEESERQTEVKISELAEVRAQLDVYEAEIEKAGETISAMEAENQELAGNNAALHDENQDLRASLMCGGGSDQSSLYNTSVSGAENAVKPKLPNKIAPRLFCDICDQFDLHETEDCPQQTMQQEESSSHSKHDVKKVVIRAYCDLCEQFGHEEVDCTSKIDEKAPSDEEF